MRTRAFLFVLIASACGAPPPTEAPTVEAEPTWSTVAVAGRLEVAIRDRLASREGSTGAVFRLTNRADDALLVDLRSLDRVVRPEAPARLRLPLSDAQISELSMISALSQIARGASITYAVPFTCQGERAVAIGGTLVALDGARTLEVVADGAEATISCGAPLPAPDGTMWVTGAGAFAAADTDPATFGAGFPDLLRAAAISGAADVALLSFSYDPRPVERWRYDACVAAGTCPERVVAQPPGSIRAPAVGMSTAGVEAFCGTRSLRGLTAEETARVADPARALLRSDDPLLVLSGFRCARSESEAPSPP